MIIIISSSIVSVIVTNITITIMIIIIIIILINIIIKSTQFGSEDCSARRSAQHPGTDPWRTTWYRPDSDQKTTRKASLHPDHSAQLVSLQ